MPFRFPSTESIPLQTLLSFGAGTAAGRAQTRGEEAQRKTQLNQQIAQGIGDFIGKVGSAPFQAQMIKQQMRREEESEFNKFLMREYNTTRSAFESARGGTNLTTLEFLKQLDTEKRHGAFLDWKERQDYAFEQALAKNGQELVTGDMKGFVRTANRIGDITAQYEQGFLTDDQYGEAYNTAFSELNRLANDRQVRYVTRFPSFDDLMSQGYITERNGLQTIINPQTGNIQTHSIRTTDQAPGFKDLAPIYRDAALTYDVTHPTDVDKQNEDRDAHSRRYVREYLEFFDKLQGEIGLRQTDPEAYAQEQRALQSQGRQPAPGGAGQTAPPGATAGPQAAPTAAPSVEEMGATRVIRGRAAVDRLNQQWISFYGSDVWNWPRESIPAAKLEAEAIVNWLATEGKRYRTMDEIKDWMEKCPIRRFEEKLVGENLLTRIKIKKI